MASKSTMKIMFPRGGIIPKEVLKADKDRKCEPGEVVTVPRAYGEHLVSDRFAEKVPADRSSRSNAADKKKAELEALEKAVTAAETVLAEANGEEAVATAQAALDAAKAALAVAAGKS